MPVRDAMIFWQRFMVMKLMMFVKHVQDAGIDRAAARMRELGFDGMDLTVRSNGSILPCNVKRELPVAVKLIQSHGLEVPLLTTNIVRADDEAAAIFQTASSLGIREIKLGYHKYESFGSFKANLAQMHRDLDTIEKLAIAHKIRANLHIHSNDHMTAQSAIVWHLIKDRQAKAIGAYVDPGHMTVEGGRDGWRQGLDLLGERITLVAVKDLAWEAAPDADLGKPRWKPRVVPLREGIVAWPNVFACLRQMNFNGWVSMHSEYAAMNSAQVFEQKKDYLSYQLPVFDRLWR
jgi:sugar phosphate isomerase/epimerase